MITKIIEATNGFNWGKFMVAQFTPDEWARKSLIDADVGPIGRSLLRSLGWDASVDHFWVLDLQTGEGAYFRHSGNASADLHKHAIWVCPLYEPFLEWLYQQPADLAALPELVDLPQAESAIYGYRRKGPGAP